MVDAKIQRDVISVLVCSTAQLAPRIGLSMASVVSLKDVLIGWHASDCDAPIRLWRIQINMGYTLPSPTWRASLTWRKQKAFPFPPTVALWVFWKSREFPAFFRGRGQSYARRHGTWNSLSQCCVKRVWEQHSLQGLRGETKIPCLISQRLTHKATQLLNALWHANRKSQYRGCRPRDWTYCLHISEHCDRKQEISLNHNHNMTC